MGFPVTVLLLSASTFGGAASALGSVHLLLTIKQLGKRNFSVGRGSRSGDLECSAGAGSPGTPAGDRRARWLAGGGSGYGAA